MATEAIEQSPGRIDPPATAAAGSSSLPEVVIRPRSGWRLVDVTELWRYRELLFFLAWRDVKIRYKQTALGLAWAVLQPGMLMLAFTMFLSRYISLSSMDVPYPLFVLCGLVPWTLFTTAVTSSANSVIVSERLITKVYFPRLAIPYAAVGASVVDFVIAVAMLGVVMAIYGHMVGIQILFAPLFVGLILIGALGLGTLLSAAVVAYRDFKYVVPFVVQLGLFATPSIYAPVQFGDDPAWTWANPMSALIQGFRSSVLGGEIPWAAVGVSAMTVVGLFLIGCLYFRKVEDDFADVI